MYEQRPGGGASCFGSRSGILPPTVTISLPFVAIHSTLTLTPMTHDELLAYYTAPGPFTSVGAFADQIDALPAEAGAIARFVHGLLIHEALAPANGVVLSPERRTEKQLHGASAMLACAARTDDGPLAEGRPPDRRVVGVCRHFATLFVACLRHKGIPARARCGFANYFQPGKNLDHWVGEYWNASEQSWILVDAQVDEHQAKFYKPDFDLLDVPPGPLSRRRRRLGAMPKRRRGPDDVRRRWHRQLGLD